MHGYDPNLSSRHISLSKKPHQALSILVIPMHEKMASGPWTIWVVTLVLGLSLLKFIIMCDDDILAIQYL